MMLSSRQKGQKRNNLLRYRQVMEEFNQYNCRVISITVIWCEYIYPRFHISRNTLYRIMKTPIDYGLAERERPKSSQPSLFD